MSLCLRFGNQRNGDLFIKLQRWHRKVGAGNTTAFPNLFNKQRIKEHTTQASSSILSFYIGSRRIHADIFWYKLKTDRLCVSDTFLYVYWYIGQPPTPMGHTHPTHTHLLYSVPGLFYFLVTFLTILKETHMYTSLQSTIQINLMKCSSSTCHLFIPRRFKKEQDHN